MAATVARVTFNDIPVENDLLRLVVSNAVGGGTTNINETFKTLRSTSAEVTIGSTINDTALNYATAFITDYGDNFNVTVLNNVVTVSVMADGDYSGFTSFVTGSFADVQLQTPTISVSGLESDRYLINNEIWIEVGSNTPSVRFDLVFTNTRTQKSSVTITIYPSPSGRARLNISPVLKSMFQYPSDARGYVTNNLPTDNSNKFSISVSSAGNPDLDLVRTFIRGGNRTNDTNQTLPVNSICRPTYLLPVWDIYPTASYYIADDGLIRKTLVAFVPEDMKDYRRSKGCNEVYLKFMNQYGGYSSWLFESHSIAETNTPQGTFIRNNILEDLGSDADSKLKIYSKVPKDYISLINDLIVSPDVWECKANTNDFVRVSVAKNSVEVDNIKRSYSVSLTVDYSFRFKPDLLW